jgi:hypothetical protein
MSPEQPAIAVVGDRIERSELARLVTTYFGDMVKLVVDLQREVVAVGGELHADAEQLLLEQGSRQSDLWGVNYYPGRGPERCVEFTALINIRPSQENLGMEIEDVATRESVRRIVSRLVGEGEEL